MARHNLDWSDLDEVIFGCANQAGEDNRNVARMSALLAGLPDTVHGTTMNRLCGSGMDAVVKAARAIRVEELDFIIAGGVESMSRAPFVMPKADAAFSRAAVERQPSWPVPTTTLAGGAGRKTGLPVWRAAPPA
jgi:acetyl-CoA acetyltransferase